MVVSMMRIREMRMSVCVRFVNVRMAVPLSRQHGRVVLMAMVHVVRMPVFVLQRFMAVSVFVSFGNVQPHANSHQGSSSNHLSSYCVSQERNRSKGADERRDREVGTGPRGAKMAYREYN